MTRIAYIDGVRLRRSLVAASDHVRVRRVELDRMNVFPVPDGDTGTNLMLTLDAIAGRVAASRDGSFAVVADAAAEGAVLGARGNSGMLLSHFLLGLAGGVAGRPRVAPADFAEAMTAGARAVESALERPVEGTMVTVIRDTADAAVRAPGTDFVPLLERMLQAARASLARTPDLLPVLAKAGVVDAGAQGFVHLLEGILGLVRGELDDPATGAPDPVGPTPAAAALTDFPEASERFRFCTEALVRGGELPDRDAVRDRLRGLGDSLIVIRSGEVLKVHVHTDDPEHVFAVLGAWGTLEATKAEDMQAQHDAVAQAELGHVSLAKRAVAVVTDSACDLPEDLVRYHGIHIVPLELVDAGKTYRDRIDVTAEAFHRKLGQSGPLPTTSQPAPAAFLEAFGRAAEEAEAIVGVFVGSTLSGTLAAAQAAAGRGQATRVWLADSLGASLLEGLLALKAAELAEEDRAPEAIVAALQRIRARSGILFTVRTFDRLIASGRVSLGKAFVGRLLGVKPILGVDENGKVEAAGKARGNRAAEERLLALVDERVRVAGGGVRFGVVHVGAPEIAERVCDRLRARYGVETEVLIAPATPVLATHLGIGAWGVAWMGDDPEAQEGIS